jgi:hypothetical protein
MADYERRHEEVERELGDMERRSERLDDEIDKAREDWESKKREARVPGADPVPDAHEPGEEAEGEGEGEDEEPPPEASYPSKD